MATGKSAPQGGAREALSARLVVGFYALMGAAAVVWRIAADGMLPWAEAPGQPVLPIHWRIAAGVGAGAALVALSRAWTARSEAGRALAAELARVLGPLSAGRALAFALASGLAEEALFRGALQPQVGFGAATLVFAAAHFVPAPKLRVWSLFALLAGAVFGALFAATGDLLAPALAHALVNALNLHWLGSPEGQAAVRPR
jgi:membrane protease YdiL (CAAX protease family)